MIETPGAMVTAVIVAAGKGERMLNPVRKQYLQVDGVPVLARALLAFNVCTIIDKIHLVVPETDFEFARNHILPFVNPHKPVRMVPGGARRQDSVYNGIFELEDNDYVVVHDGVRPFVRNEDIINCLNAARRFGAAILGIPVMDTLKKAEKDLFIEKTIERKSVWLAQTPQAFQCRILKKAHEMAKQKGLTGTDDASLVEAMAEKVKIVPGSPYNIKITTPEDLKLARALLNEENLP
jgi:2-C-methyl-D-erythritol 4-phosphate cytidylyltransferase